MHIFCVFVYLYLYVGLVKSDYELPMLNFNTSECESQCCKDYKILDEVGLLLKMADASSKLPPGILTGNVRDYGNFDECLSIEYKTKNHTIFGKYCARSLHVDVDKLMSSAEGLTLELSMCIPSSCKLSDVFNKTGIMSVDEMCETKEDATNFDWGDYVVGFGLVVIVVLMAISTIYDFYSDDNEKKANNPLFIAFSVLTNGRKLFSVTTPHQLTCLHALRFISMLWVILGHRFATTTDLPIMNLGDVLKWEIDNLYSFYVHAAPFAVDTFFFRSGLLISYDYFTSLKNNPMTIKHIPIYYIHRLFQITPGLAALYFIQITLIRYIGSGPLWVSVHKQIRDACVDHWWSFFLFIQNYVNPTNLCIVNTWYVSADMQMFILSPLVILPLGHFALKNKNFGYAWIAVLIAGAITIPMIVQLFININSAYDTHTRISAWLVGLLMGMFMFEVQNNKQPRMRQTLNVLIWILTLSIMLAIALCMPGVKNHPTNLKTNLYFTYSRPAWCMCLGWIIYACTTGSGGIVNWFLTRPFFQVMCRLSYSLYLLNGSIIMVQVCKMRSSIYFDDYNMLYIYCGDVVLTMIMSIVWVLTFESPMIAIEKVIFKTNTARKLKSEEDIKVNMA